MTDPTEEQASQEENPAEEVELSKETLEDLDADQSDEDVKGGGIRCTYINSGC